MNVTQQLKAVNWLKILLFYALVLAATFGARQLPNLLQLLLEQVSDIPFSVNYNHGIVTLLAALLFYRFGGIQKEISLLGNKKGRSILFPVILLAVYSIYGIANYNGVNEHLWALMICSLALGYNIMEEFAWRGFLIDGLGKTNYVIKSILSGIFWGFWHLLIFENFDQFGGFGMFFVFCVVFSFLLTFAVLRTKSVLVAAAIHAFMIQMNSAAIICFVLFALLLLTWNKTPFTKQLPNLKAE